MANPNEVTEFDDLLLRHATTGVKQVWFTRKEVLAVVAESIKSSNTTSDAAGSQPHDSPKVSAMLASGVGGFFDKQKYPDLEQPAEPTSTAQARQDAYRAGWVTAAGWAQRNDLLSDIGSPAYLKDMANALQNL